MRNFCTWWGLITRPYRQLTLILAALSSGAFAAPLWAGTLPMTFPLEWEFAVYLGDKPIGSHAFTLQQEGEGLKLHTEASFDVKFLFITAYTYRHRNTELWDEEGLISINATTDANGKIQEVNGSRQGDVFILNSRADEEVLPAGLMTFAYWNPEFLKESRLLNSQTGEVEPVRVIEQGPDQVKFGERSIPAIRYDVVLQNGGLITVWYAMEDNRWVALESVTDSGRLIRYRPVRLPEHPVELASLLME